MQEVSQDYLPEGKLKHRMGGIKFKKEKKEKGNKLESRRDVKYLSNVNVNVY